MVKIPCSIISERWKISKIFIGIMNAYKYNARWFGESFHCFSDSSFSRGVSVLFRKNLPVEILNVHKTIDGRKILIKIKIDNDIITLVNVYAPNNEQNRTNFFKQMQTFINHHALNIENVLLCGDFNCITSKTSDKSAIQLNAICRNIDMFDLWCSNHENLSGYTWCNAENVPKSRIDYILVRILYTTLNRLLLEKYQDHIQMVAECLTIELRNVLFICLTIKRVLVIGNLIQAI